MIGVDEAIAQLLVAAPRPKPAERVELAGAAGRVLADDVVAPLDVPPADNSAMDGYAFRHADWRDAGTALPVSQRIAAGAPPAALAPGTAARIFTGAEIPAGADTVVMQEHCEATDAGVRIDPCPERGRNIRPRGQDLRAGETVLRPGRRLRPQDLGLIASLGIDRVSVRPRLRVAVLSTGDELLEPGDAPAPGKIFNSNRYVLGPLLEGWGMEVVDLGIARDTPGSVRAVLKRAAETADVIVASGGVSVGEEDHVKAVVQAMGELALWRVAVKPGKPFAFGRVGDTPFLGLPGNPVSVLVTALVIARPYLLRAQGVEDVTPRAAYYPAGFDQAGGPRREYLRCRVRDGRLHRHPRASSGVLSSTTWADGLALQHRGQDIAEGDAVAFYPWSALG